MNVECTERGAVGSLKKFSVKYFPSFSYRVAVVNASRRQTILNPPPLSSLFSADTSAKILCVEFIAEKIWIFTRKKSSSTHTTSENVNSSNEDIFFIQEKNVPCGKIIWHANFSIKFTAPSRKLMKIFKFPSISFSTVLLLFPSCQLHVNIKF